jgi:multidrug efflux pump subunit AcrA (membrane-fusion protein)
MRFIARRLTFDAASRWQFLVVGTAAGALFMAAGCQQPANSERIGQSGRSEPPSVKVGHPEKRNVRRLIERPGYNIQAYERTLIYADIAGYVRKWNSDMGDNVHKDQVLAELYVPEMEVELKQKEAAIQQASSEIKLAEAAMLRSQAELKRALSQYQRLAKVGDSGVLDREQVEEARLGFEGAQAALAKAQAEVEVAKARLEVAKTSRDHVQALLQYTEVRAPYDGVITRRNVNKGDLVQPGSGGKADPLFIMEQIKPVRVFVNIQELDAVWVRDKDVALIRVQSLQGQQFKGEVTRTSRSLDPQNRTLRTEIDLPNTDGKLSPGMFVNATIIAEHKNVWSLPAKAVVTQGEESFCYRVEGGKAVRTAIQVGLRGSELVEVLKKQVRSARPAEEPRWEDFSGDEVIIVTNPTSLTDNQVIGMATDHK